MLFITLISDDLKHLSIPCILLFRRVYILYSKAIWYAKFDPVGALWSDISSLILI